MTHDFRLHEVVRLRSDVPEDGLRAGAVGVVVEVFDQPYVAYEVEFVDDKGRTIAQRALRPSEIRPADNPAPAV